MSSQQTDDVMQDQEKQVIEFLRTHPHFLDNNPSLLAELSVPHGLKGNLESLIERQVKLLREQNRDFKARLQELIAIARENDDLHQRLNKLVVAMLAVDQRDALIALLKTQLHEDFAADAVNLHLREGDIEPEWQELYSSVAGVSVKCGNTAEVNKQLLFGDMADGIDSLALLSLGKYGLLAIGSHDEERFHKDVATDYLKQLAEVIKAMLARLS